MFYPINPKQYCLVLEARQEQQLSQERLQQKREKHAMLHPTDTGMGDTFDEERFLGDLCRCPDGTYQVGTRSEDYPPRDGSVVVDELERIDDDHFVCDGVPWDTTMEEPPEDEEA